MSGKKVNVTNYNTRSHPALSELENDTFFTLSDQKPLELRKLNSDQLASTTLYFSHSRLEKGHYEPSDYDSESQEEYADNRVTVCYCFDEQGNQVLIDNQLVKPIHNPGEFPENALEALLGRSIVSNEIWTDDILLKIRQEIEKSGRNLKEQPYTKLQVELDSAYLAVIAADKVALENSFSKPAEQLFENPIDEETAVVDTKASQEIALSKAKRALLDASQDGQIETNDIDLVNYFIANSKNPKSTVLAVTKRVQDQVAESGYSVDQWYSNRCLHQSIALDPSKSVEWIHGFVYRDNDSSKTAQIDIRIDSVGAAQVCVWQDGLAITNCLDDGSGRYPELDGIFLNKGAKLDAANTKLRIVSNEGMIAKETNDSIDTNRSNSMTSKKYSFSHDKNNERITTLSSDAALLEFMKDYANPNAGVKITTATQALDYIAANCTFLRLIDYEITEADILTKDTGLGSENDYTLNSEGSIWVSAKELSLNINMTDDGLKVSVYPKGDEFNHPIDELFVAHKECEDESDGMRM